MSSVTSGVNKLGFCGQICQGYQMQLKPRPGSERGVDATAPEIFLRCTPNYEADRAETLHSLWGVVCTAFGEKKIDRVMSGHGAMTSQEVQGQVIFARNSGIWHIRRRYRGFV